MWSPEDHVFCGGKTLGRSPSPTSFLLRAGLLASTGSDQSTRIPFAFISQGHSSILPGERGMLWGVTHIHHVQAVRCVELRVKPQHAAIWEIYRNASSLYTFPALFSEASLSALCNINAHSHCSYFKVRVSCYEVSIPPLTAFSSSSL